ncbi:MAG: NADH-quinone oxidoreductase subunit K [Campylobacterales bacterium]
MLTLYTIGGVAILVLGAIGVILQKGFVHKLISLNIFTSGVFLILITLSHHGDRADSVATALVLTGLVVTIGATSFALMLIRAYYKKRSYE